MLAGFAVYLMLYRPIAPHFWHPRHPELTRPIPRPVRPR